MCYVWSFPAKSNRHSEQYDERKPSKDGSTSIFYTSLIKLILVLTHVFSLLIFTLFLPYNDAQTKMKSCELPWLTGRD